jgi:phosphocarrier protein
VIETQVTIINKLGLHARAAAKLVDCAARFGCRVQLGLQEPLSDAKSIMAVMMLAAGKGSQLWLRCDGEDETDAMAALCALIEDRFGEPE